MSLYHITGTYHMDFSDLDTTLGKCQIHIAVNGHKGFSFEFFFNPLSARTIDGNRH